MANLGLFEVRKCLSMNEYHIPPEYFQRKEIGK
jgi:hypothetical protein